MNKNKPLDLVKENPRVNIKHLTILSVVLSVLIIVGAFIYSFYVLLMTTVAIFTGVIVEYVFMKVRKRPYKINAGSVVTPLIFVSLMPPELPLYIVVVGTFFGVFFGKMMFGGLGRNIFEPAVAAFLFVLVTFPFDVGANFIDPITGSVLSTTALADSAIVGTSEQLFGLLLGQYANSVAGTMVLAVCIGGVILLFLRAIDWKIPLSVLLATAVFTIGFDQFYPDQFGNAFITLFQGQLIFIAFFVATDPVTAPRTSRGRVLYGIGIALITVVIRGLANADEGVIYAVIIMNAVGPMLEPAEVIEEEKA